MPSTSSYSGAVASTSTSTPATTSNGGHQAQASTSKIHTAPTPTHAQTLPASPSEQQLLFAKATMITFDLWPALKLAVEEEWGGPESRDKAEFLLSTICDYCDEFTPSTEDSAAPDPPDQDEIADTLDEYMSHEYNVRLEDGSIEYVAQRLVALWKIIFLQPEAAAHEALKQLEEARAKLRGQKVAAQHEETDEEDSDFEEEGEGADQADEDGMDVDEGPSQSREPIVDEDGFTLVSNGNRRRK